jgi:biotin carboxylase
MADRVLLLIPNNSYRTHDFMEAATKLGIDVIVGSDRSSPFGDAGAGRQVSFDFSDVDRGVEQVEAYASKYPVGTIVAVDDAGTRLAAHASRRLELPHNPVTAVEATRDKSLLRESLAAAGLPSPRWTVVPRGADIPRIAAEIEYPVVLKPLSMSASRGVMRANDAAEFEAAFRRIEAILDDPEYSLECPGFTDRVLVEGYLPGYEVSVEGVLAAGRLKTLAIFDKPDPLEGPYFEETIYVTPSRHPEQDTERITAISERAVRALGLEAGPVHIELRVNDEGVFPIDVAARSIGGLCSRTLSFGTGMSLEELLLRCAMGRDVPSYDREMRAAGVMMIPIPRAGVLRAVEGVDGAEAVPLIESVTISIPVGEKVVPLPEGNEYLGFIFAKGETPAEVEDALRESHRQITFMID